MQKKAKKAAVFLLSVMMSIFINSMFANVQATEEGGCIVHDEVEEEYLHTEYTYRHFECKAL